jgi:hypothetical protein
MSIKNSNDTTGNRTRDLPCAQSVIRSRTLYIITEHNVSKAVAFGLQVKTFKGTENCALLGYYAASGGNLLPTFWDNLSVSSSWTLKMGPTGCPETSVRNYHYSLRNKDRRGRFSATSRRKPEITHLKEHFLSHREQPAAITNTSRLMLFQLNFHRLSTLLLHVLAAGCGDSDRAPLPVLVKTKARCRSSTFRPRSGDERGFTSGTNRAA